MTVTLQRVAIRIFGLAAFFAFAYGSVGQTDGTNSQAQKDDPVSLVTSM
jgi:hypothetical protein